MHALEPGAAGVAWVELARRLPRPKAILMASAHWETDAPRLTGAAQPETIHDFSGFPRPLYQIRYAAPGAPALAARAHTLLKDAGFDAQIDGERGLDHGAWSPLLHMYPQADIPVVQISLQTELGPRHHYEVGHALAPLAGEDILIFGSGHMTHNLRDRMRPDDNAYALEFQAWTDARIREHDHEALIGYRLRAPHAVRAHPSDEHFLPLFVALGAAGRDARVERVHDGIEGVLAMDAYRFDAP
jgi:4,5-DOPA dioxygenase extradiol